MVKTETSFDLGLFFTLSPDLLCIAGFDGYFKQVNPAFSKLLGYSMEELLSRPINDFVYQADSDYTRRIRQNIIEGNPLLNFENRYVTKFGEVIWLSWTSIPVVEEKVVYAIAKNITHKKELEEDQKSLIVNLTEINKEFKVLNCTTSHDLRAPVNNLDSVFDLMDFSKIQDPEILEFFDLLKLSIGDLKTTLNNYVDALGEKEVMNIQIQELILEDSLKEVLASLKSLIKASSAKIHFNFSELEKVHFNKAYLKSIFINLITNSIKYRQPDSIPDISVFSRKIDGVKQLIFLDKGLGFDMENVKNRVFGFKQKFHNHIDSKGIGLYLLYNHVTSLGGKIDLESKPNEGAKFIISFKV